MCRETEKQVPPHLQGSENYETLTILGDGNCLFRALSYGLYDTQQYHANVRSSIVSEVVQNWDTYKHFIIGDTAYGANIYSEHDYKRCMGSSGKYGGHQELQAFVSINTQVYVEVHSSKELLACYGNKKTSECTMTLLFSGSLDRGHYNFLKPIERVHYRSNDDVSVLDTPTDEMKIKKGRSARKRARRKEREIEFYSLYY